jgi:hypothetical protein
MNEILMSSFKTEKYTHFFFLTIKYNYYNIIYNNIEYKK